MWKLSSCEAYFCESVLRRAGFLGVITWFIELRFGVLTQWVLTKRMWAIEADAARQRKSVSGFELSCGEIWKTACSTRDPALVF